MEKLSEEQRMDLRLRIVELGGSQARIVLLGLLADLSWMDALETALTYVIKD